MEAAVWAVVGTSPEHSEQTEVSTRGGVGVWAESLGSGDPQQAVRN